MAGELAALKADAHQWLEGPEYEALRLRLENAHAAAEAALVEARLCPGGLREYRNRKDDSSICGPSAKW
jgi:hypothetical protein